MAMLFLANEQSEEAVTRRLEYLLRFKSPQEKKASGLQIAKLYYDIKSLDVAMGHIFEYMTVCPDDAAAHKLLGRIQEDQKNSVSAIESYKRSVEINPHQPDLVTRIGKLLCQSENVDPQQAEHWSKKLSSMGRENLLAQQLKEKAILGRPPNTAELETTLRSELTQNPESVELNLRLLRLYIETGRTREAYERLLQLEQTPYYNKLQSSTKLLQYLVTELFPKYEELNQGDVWFEIRKLYTTAVLIQHSFPKAACSEIAQTINRLDQLLFSFVSSRGKTVADTTIKGIVREMEAQLFYLSATLIFKRESLSRTDVSRPVSYALYAYLVSHQIPPTESHADVGLSQSSVVEETSLRVWRQRVNGLGLTRMSDLGHVILQFSDTCLSADWKNQFCSEEGQRTFHKYTLLTSELCKYKESSYLCTSNLWADSVSKVTPPDTLQLNSYDTESATIFPSLPRLVWTALHHYKPSDPYQPASDFTPLFPKLREATTDLNKASPDSLSLHDVQAFFFTTVRCTALNWLQSAADNVVPPFLLSTDLCTRDQESWWNAALSVGKQTNSKTDYAQIRSTLEMGLRVIRLLPYHGMHPTLIIHLASSFQHLVKQLGAYEPESLVVPNEVIQLEARTVFYWQRAVQKLKAIAKGEHISLPPRRLFNCGEFDHQISSKQAEQLIEQGTFCTAVHHMHLGKHEEALSLFDACSSVYASYFQAKIYMELYSSLASSSGEELTSELRSKESAFLIKSRDALHLCMDRLRSDRYHKLNSLIADDLDTVEAELARICPSTMLPQSVQSSSESMDFLSSNNLEAAGGFYGNALPRFNASPQRIVPAGQAANKLTRDLHMDFSTLRNNSTPPPQQRLSRPAHVQPSPERLDAQLRSVTLDSATLQRNLTEALIGIRGVIEESTNQFVSEQKDSSRRVCDELRDLRRAVTDLKDEMKTLRLREGTTASSSTSATDQPKPTPPQPQAAQASTAPPSYPFMAPPPWYAYAYAQLFANQMNPAATQQQQPGMMSNIPAASSMTSSLMQPNLIGGVTTDGFSLPQSSYQQTSTASLSQRNALLTAGQSIQAMQPVGQASPTASLLTGKATVSHMPVGMPAYESALANINQEPPPVTQRSSAADRIPVEKNPPPNAVAPVTGTLPSTSLSSATSQTLPAVRIPSQHIKGASAKPFESSAASSAAEALVSAVVSTSFAKTVTTATTAGVPTTSESKASPFKFDFAAPKSESPSFTDFFKPPTQASVPANTSTSSATPGKPSTVSGSPLLRSLLANAAATPEQTKPAEGIFGLPPSTGHPTKSVFGSPPQVPETTTGTDTTPVKPPPSFSEIVKQQAGTWECQLCLVRNPQTESACVACGTRKPGDSSDASSEAGAASNTGGAASFGGFGSKPAPVFGGFKFGAPCGFKKEPDLNAPGFSFGLPKLDAKVQLDATAKDKPDLEIVFSNQPTNEQKDICKKYLLSPSFHRPNPLFAHDPAGCIACADEEVIDLFFEGKPIEHLLTKPTPVKVPQNEPAKPIFGATPSTKPIFGAIPSVTPIFGATPQASAQQPIFGVTPTFNTTPSVVSSTAKTEPSAKPFVFGGDSQVSFAALAAQSDTSAFGSGKSSESFQFQGAGTKLFGSFLKSPKSPEVSQNQDADNLDTSETPTVDPHFEPIIPLPDLVETKTGEEDETAVFCHRAKLYRFVDSDAQWKERGVGDMKILKHNQTGKFRLLLRREQVLKLACNHLLLPEMKLSTMPSSETSWCWVAHDFADPETAGLTKFAVRFKKVEMAQKFKEMFEESQAELLANQSASESPAKREESRDNEPTEELCKHQPESHDDDSEARGTELETDDQEKPEDYDAAAEDDEDEYEDYEETVLITKSATLFVSESGNDWQRTGSGTLTMTVDDDLFGARLRFLINEQEYCNHIICVGKALTRHEMKCEWEAIDFLTDEPLRKHFRAQFSSSAAAIEFEETYNRGLQMAQESELYEISLQQSSGHPLAGDIYDSYA